MRKLLAVMAIGLLLPFGAMAKDNLASQPTDLPDLEITADLKISQTEYHLETGKSYRLVIKSDGGEEFSLRAPDFFRNVWLNGVETDDVSIMAQSIYSIDFEDEGEVTILFVPIRPGKYDYWVHGFENRGLAGSFIVD
jgi:uncharacterized cupredoxin-like copper-binding protein